MPTLNNETKSKPSMLKMQLTTKQRVFALPNQQRSRSKRGCPHKFPEKEPPANRAAWRNIKWYKSKYQ